jgi:uncharacterized SAM-binding protein YcdF (DUF218 family)
VPALRRLLRKALLGLLLVLLAIYSFAASRIYSFAQVDETTSADVAIVLGAAAYRTRPSPVFAERINHAIELYRRGWVKLIIFTGGFGRGRAQADSQIAREYALQRGVPASAIYIETVSTDTEENLVEAQKLMQLHGWQTALLVSDPLHMYRSHLVADDLGIDALSSPTETSRYRTVFSRAIFLLRESYSVLQYWLSGIINQ